MGLLRRRGEQRRPGGRGDGALSYTLERLGELNYHRLLLHGPADAHDAHAKVYGRSAFRSAALTMSGVRPPTAREGLNELKL